MKFNVHSELLGQHAFLSASKYHWVNYTNEKLKNTFTKYQAIQRGTELHELANRCIRLKVKLPKSRSGLNMFVNDAIGYRMLSEQVLYYSPNAFGTADAISFRDDFLRIHDLKTGETRVSLKQLEIYAALFCLEYGYSPHNIGIELRIYQGDEILYLNPEPNEIDNIMNKIIEFDETLEKIKEEME